MTDFDNRIVLITGAARGLGFAYARCVAAHGAKVLIQDIGADSNGSGQNPTIAEDAASTLRSEGLNVQAIAGSIDTQSGCYALIDKAIAAHGRLDAIVHNAGWVAYETIEEIKEESFDRMMSVAAKAPLWMAQAAWQHMREAGYGRIVFTTSCRALYPEHVHEGLASYAAAKMAAVGIVNVLAAEGREHNIVVNAICPVAKTRMWGVEGEPDELRPADVAPGAAFLASEACTDGGWVLRAANGQFHATRSCEAEGVDYPRDLRAVEAASLSDIAENWRRIAVPTVEARQ